MKSSKASQWSIHPITGNAQDGWRLGPDELDSNYELDVDVDELEAEQLSTMKKMVDQTEIPLNVDGLEDLVACEMRLLHGPSNEGAIQIRIHVATDRSPNSGLLVWYREREDLEVMQQALQLEVINPRVANIDEHGRMRMYDFRSDSCVKYISESSTAGEK